MHTAMASVPQKDANTMLGQFSPRSLGSYAFLNHSSSTLLQNLPPDVDDKPLARQRRRRTSPQDHAILEAAYKLNPRPDKIARSQLVKQVALSEKEVQIWFQNRRQTSRRKIQPMVPFEVANCQVTQDDAAGARTTFNQSQFPSAAGWDPSLPDSGDKAMTAKPNTQSDLVPVVQSFDEQHRDIAVTFSPHKRPHSIGYLADRRSAPSLRHQTDCNGLANHSNGGIAAALRRSSSGIRLSMTSDGKACVTTKDMLLPSPPRAKPTSVIQTQPYRRVPVSKSLHRPSSGRSQDSRTWEFWCDRDARQDLQEKADRDTSGSAVDAIGMLRSLPGRTVLGVLSSRRNTTVRIPQQRSNRKVPYSNRPFRRSSIIGDRLRKQSASPKMVDNSFSIHVPGNDSDKENWSPGGDASPDIAKDLQSSPPELYGSASQPSISAACDASLRQRKSVASSDGGLPSDLFEADPEIAAFMRGTHSASDESDLDCVQGLLSLSQGNWR